MSPPPLYLSHEPAHDWLFALPFGAVSDGQPAERWRELEEDFAFYLDPETGEPIGFGVHRFSELDLDNEDLAELWTGPRFAAPVLGLANASAGEIILAARAHYGETPSPNRLFFEFAAAHEGEEALRYWQLVLDHGDSMAHFALGYTLYDLGRFHEAYRHLRHYTEIAPAHSWVWAWYAKAAAAIGETGEAVAACKRSLELTAAGSDETDAGELLATLRG